jgi:hypothetical protein
MACVFISYTTDDVLVPISLFLDFVSIVSACVSVTSSNARTGVIFQAFRRHGFGRSLLEGWDRYMGKQEEEATAVGDVICAAGVENLVRAREEGQV